MEIPLSTENEVTSGSLLRAAEIGFYILCTAAILRVRTTMKLPRSVDPGAGSLDHRRQTLLVGRAIGGGVGRAHPQRRRALLEVGGLKAVALQRLLGERRQLFDHGRRQAGRAADAAPRIALVAG